MVEYEPLKMADEDCKSVYTLNTWTDDVKAEARKYLEEGYWVRFGSTCIGHTSAEIVEHAGWKWVREEYGEENIQEAKREGWSYWYIRLVKAERSPLQKVKEV